MDVLEQLGKFNVDELAALIDIEDFRRSVTMDPLPARLQYRNPLSTYSTAAMTALVGWPSP
jgi:hypothetical protein